MRFVYVLKPGSFVVVCRKLAHSGLETVNWNFVVVCCGEYAPFGFGIVFGWGYLLIDYLALLRLVFSAYGEVRSFIVSGVLIVVVVFKIS